MRGRKLWSLKKGLKSEKLCITFEALHYHWIFPAFFLKFEIRILFADTILYFQVFLDVREMPPYELLLKIFLCDPRGLQRR